ncbi:MAG: hypothetical protein GWN99_01815 [Gemmatimonadetes bacterium]|uniref:Uncharacterized protein n=1 Tax=Candidatus Kutchimonas denitrificans TaxID=3056748 RepID=A0AAE4Z819_9BACT|nr:hypothetical protein [Gemmatimonadota bacterium]NIR74182.1 hypothetical protein [Candidatus Kutchimonas denitrificans]NIR99804.1 hypothetical protein [Gemmatimonadota bacterium]NIT65393.1 hypothetical protein [Gemmatimonadota bacterium]NIU51759.1 hypothetical protein [Gemmatimonadota bacterium]
MLGVRTGIGFKKGGRAASRRPVLAAALICFVPATASAQWIDAQLPRRGELQIGLTATSSTVGARLRPDGTRQPLAEVFLEGIGARQAPELSSLDSLLAAFYPQLGLPVPDSSGLGVISYDVLVEHTRAPISLSYGAMKWLAIFATVPLVYGKSFVNPGFDTLQADAGPAATAFGANPDAFFQDLGAGIGELESIVAADTLDPARQAAAAGLLADAQALEAGLTGFRDQVYVPTDTGAAGQQLNGFYSDVQSGFTEFGLDLPELTLAQPIAVEQAIGLTSGEAYGFDAPQTRWSGIKFGDIEVGLSLQPLNTFTATPENPRPTVPVRLKLDALYRFASGSPPAANFMFDPGTGQGQPDLELHGALDVGFGRRFWLSTFASYNLQFSADVERLVTSPESPIQQGAFTSTVRWDPGDILTLVAAPRFNLSRAITFAGLIRYQRHGKDQYTALDPIEPAAPFVPADLERNTRWWTTSFGFAVRYSGTDWSGDSRRSTIPLEIELRYLKVTSGGDGFAPARNVWEVGTRFYWSVFQ